MSRPCAWSDRGTCKKATFPPRLPTIARSPRPSPSPRQSTRTRLPKTTSGWERSSKLHSIMASTRRGLELILENYGTCPAITAFEQLPPHDGKTRSACAERLVDHLHEELTSNLRAEIASRGQVVPPAGTSIADLVAGRAWLFTDDAYHIDISHLSSVVRMSLLAQNPEAIAKAADLTAYGTCLSPRLVFEGSPPFEHIFEDYGVYLKALLGRDADEAIAHFQEKLSQVVQKDGEPGPAAQVLVNLLLKFGRIGAAIDVSAAHLASIPESELACPSFAELCQKAGQSDRLARVSREQGDLVSFTAARIQASRRLTELAGTSSVCLKGRARSPRDRHRPVQDQAHGAGCSPRDYAV